jgi:hypothetical protein
VWAPVSLGKDDLGHTPDTPTYTVIARLHTGVKPATALSELSTIQRHATEIYLPTDPGGASYARLTSYSGTLVDHATSVRSVPSWARQ